MRFKSSFNLAAALLLLVLSAMTASAQTAQASGKVTLRQADGTEAPLQGATVTFYRTDIKGKYDVKTNRKGEYVRLGMPFGTFTVVVSAPNAQPSYATGISISRQPNNDFTLTPGDGRVLTLEDVKAAAAATTTTATAPAANAATPGAAPASGEQPAVAPASGEQPAAAAPVSEAEAKRLAAEYEREKAAVEAKNARAVALNATLPEILTRGNDAFNAKNFDAAIAAYDEGIAADPEQGVFYANKAAALRERAVPRYNAAANSKDQAAIKAARDDFKAAVDASEKALAAYRSGATQSNQGAAATGGAAKTNDVNNALGSRAESYRLAMLTSTPGVADAAVKAIQEYLAVETDAAKKTKLQGELVKALIESNNNDEAIATLKQMLAADPNNLLAMYGLGMKLAGDSAQAGEATKVLRDFAAKAKGQEYADRRQEAIATADALDEFIKSEQQPKTAPARRNTRRPGQ